MPDLATMLIQYATSMIACVDAVEVGGASVDVDPTLVVNRTSCRWLKTKDKMLFYSISLDI